MRDPVSHMRDPVSHMRDPVSHMRDPVSHMRDPVSHMRDPVSHMRTLCAHDKWLRGCSIIEHSPPRPRETFLGALFLSPPPCVTLRLWRNDPTLTIRPHASCD